jgi:hypothetical protein
VKPVSEASCKGHECVCPHCHGRGASRARRGGTLSPKVDSSSKIDVSLKGTSSRRNHDSPIITSDFFNSIDPNRKFTWWNAIKGIDARDLSSLGRHPGRIRGRRPHQKRRRRRPGEFHCFCRLASPDSTSRKVLISAVTKSKKAHTRGVLISRPTYAQEKRRNINAEIFVKTRRSVARTRIMARFPASAIRTRFLVGTPLTGVRSFCLDAN